MMYVQLSRANDTSRSMDKFLVLIIFSIVIASNDVFAARLPYGLRRKDKTTIDVSSMKLLKDLYEANDDKNVVTSPLGIFVLLSLYSTVTNGTSRKEIENYLGFQDYSQLTNSFEYLSESLSSLDPNLLTFANKVCISDKYQLEKEFVTLAKRRYHSEVSSIDLQDPEAAADSVNQWAHIKSGGNIVDPMGPSMFTPDTVALLLNVIYFQGKWKYPFGVNDTTEEAFHVSPTETILKPTMRIMREFTYGYNILLKARVIQLPYNETDFSMLIVVPDEIDGLPSLLETFTETGAQCVFGEQDMKYRKVYLQMPKFKVETKFNVKDILVKEGVRGIFDKYNTGVVKGEEVRVSEVFQQASITVDEAGTEAAAFTYFGLELRCLMEEDEPVFFLVDRPFFYAILHKDVVLFTGTYTH